MDPIAKTAYYCCGVRMVDARSAHPVCGDFLARRFMDSEALAVFERFEDFKMPNASNVARHRVIDDWLRDWLRARPDLPVVLLGAGFDTRAFRLDGGRWLELDQPALIASKEGTLPAARCPNPLQRVAIDFAREPLADKLAPLRRDKAPVVVMEGVSMYLEPGELSATLRTLKRTFSDHTLVCDLMTRAFARRYGGPLRQRIEALGGRFAELLDDPAALVTGEGYRVLDQRSIPQSAVDFGTVPIPRWLLATLLRALRDGYQLYVFRG
jgi:methyltransferase (TIGR00027 family)